LQVQDVDIDDDVPLTVQQVRFERIDQHPGVAAASRVRFDLEVADLHGARIDDEVRHLTNSCAIAAQDRPPARIGIFF
jgi:hypothetical protein